MNPRGRYEQSVLRSWDLIRWESSPLNPVLRASDEDRKVHNPKLTPQQRQRIATAKNSNNSDIDFCAYRGPAVIFCSWGNQEGVEHLLRRCTKRRSPIFCGDGFSRSRCDGERCSDAKPRFGGTLP